MSAEPFASAAGVKVRVPVASTAGGVEKRPGLVLAVMVKPAVWADSLAGPVEIADAQALL